MLFNSYEFIFLFLPLALLGFCLIGRGNRQFLAFAWLVAASLFFYGYWNPKYVGLIYLSIIFNYSLGSFLQCNSKRTAASKVLLIFGITVNLALLGYFKYTNFFLDNLNAIIGSDFNLGTIILPLGISFFTFQQIAYLTDAYLGTIPFCNFLHYCLFVTFFPQLIAGPIVHYQEMMPQFAEGSSRPNNSDLAVGITIFSIGLFKKVALADTIAYYANLVFGAASSGVTLSLSAAWVGAIAYTFQLYFDFSGYADMAIGIARMFGIKLPLNFYSPYKSVNIIEFWRRWHMTLSRWLRDYLYIPLGGNRKGAIRKYLNLMLTMLLGGLWHGAGWTFVIWGGLHGAYLVVNNGWQSFRSAMGRDLKQSTWWGRWMGRMVTFVAVVISWVYFRAESTEVANHILEAMCGFHGFASANETVVNSKVIFMLLGLTCIAWFFPNTQEFMRNHNPALVTYKIDSQLKLFKWLHWEPNRPWAIFTASLNLICLTKLSEITEFLYFQF